MAIASRAARQRIAVQRVGGLEDRPAAGRLDCPDALHAALLAAADDGHARPGRGQRIGHGAAQNARAAEDDGGFLFQIEQIVLHLHPSTNSGFRWRS